MSAEERTCATCKFWGNRPCDEDGMGPCLLDGSPVEGLLGGKFYCFNWNTDAPEKLQEFWREVNERMAEQAGAPPPSGRIDDVSQCAVWVWPVDEGDLQCGLNDEE